MRTRFRVLVLIAVLALGLLPVAPSSAQTEGEGENMEFVENIPYGNRFGLSENYGTDSDFIEMTIGGQVRQIGVFGTIDNGAFVMDVTDGSPVELAWYACGIGQGDVQLFQREEVRDGQPVTATYFTYTEDGYEPNNGAFDCVQWRDEHKDNSEIGNGQGTYIVDITDPGDPQTRNFINFEFGSHNMTVHPSGNYLYNSNSELITNVLNPGIEIWDIHDLDAPFSEGTLPLPPRPGLGTDSHDISFSADGTRAYSAALSQTVIIDTTDAAAPVVISSTEDPMINVEHQAEPITLTDPLLGEREFLIVEDEFAGAAGAERACPSGGVHIYDITGDLENTPIKVGFWNIDDVRLTDPFLGSCTAHVFQLHPEAGLMTISFYNGGVRVVDISGLVGVALGDSGVGMREVASYVFPDSNSWSVKTPEITVDEAGGYDFHMYSNDINRGLDVFRVTGNVADEGTGNDLFLTAAQALTQLPPAALAGDYRPFCLLGDRQQEEEAAPTAAVLDLGVSRRYLP